MEKSYLFYVIWLVVVSVKEISGNFRGALITWKPIGDDGEQILVTYRIAWRLRKQPHIECSIRAKELNPGASKIYFRSPSGDIETIKRADYYCNGDISTYNDWIIGENAFKYTLQPGVTKFSIGFSDCCWRGISNLDVPNAKWRLWTTIDVTKKTNGVINSSPISSFFPVVYATVGCENEWKVPVFDRDNDVVKCRFANKFDECGNACFKLPNAVLDEDHCILKFTSPPQAERYVVALQLEDFESVGSKTPKSSVGIQFTVVVMENRLHALCKERPKITMMTRKTTSCLQANVGKEINFEFVAKSYNDDDPIVEVLTSSPSGTRQPTLELKENNKARATLAWTPTQNGFFFICYTAVTKFRKMSEEKCTLIHVGENSLNTNKGFLVYPSRDRDVPISIDELIVKFQRPIKLQQSHQIDASIIDSHGNIVLELESKDLQIQGLANLRVDLDRLPRQYGEKYELKVTSLVTNEDNVYCSTLELEKIRFEMTSMKDKMTLQCEQDGFSLALNKYLHAPYEIVKAHLTNAKCAAKIDNSHVTISSNYNRCWTRVVVNNTHATYINSLHCEVKRPDGRFGDTYTETKDIACVIARKFKSNNNVKQQIGFEKMFANYSAANFIPKSKVGRVLVTFSMFLDKDFKDRYFPFEFPLKLKNTKKLFFGVTMENNDADDAKLVLDNCYATSKPFVNRERYYFVKNRCADSDVFKMIKKEQGQLRFSLHLAYAMHLMNEGAYFHCEVTVCHWCRMSCDTTKRRTKRAIDYGVSFLLSTGKLGI